MTDCPRRSGVWFQLSTTGRTGAWHWRAEIKASSSTRCQAFEPVLVNRARSDTGRCELERLHSLQRRMVSCVAIAGGGAALPIV